MTAAVTPRLKDAFGEHRGKRCVVRAAVLASDSLITNGAVVLTLAAIGCGPRADATLTYADALAVRDMLADVLARAVEGDSNVP